MLAVWTSTVRKFLSIQAQDFIEDSWADTSHRTEWEFLSIQAQDFIEDEDMHVLP